MKLCGQKVYPGATLATRINPHAGTLCMGHGLSMGQGPRDLGRPDHVGRWIKLLFGSNIYVYLYLA